MAEQIRLGFVGMGNRGRMNLTQIYEIRDREYLHSAAPDGHPYVIYHNHAYEAPSWAEDVSDLIPTVTAIFDPSEAARRIGVEICADKGDRPQEFGSFASFVEHSEYDAVVISSPNDQHVDEVLALLDKGVDLFCEKPVATTLRDHDRIIEACAKSNAILYAGFNLRVAPLFSRIKEALLSGAVGHLGMVAAREIRGPFRDGYRYTQAESGGSLLEKVCHDFDLFNWYVDGEPRRVTAFGNQHVFGKLNDSIDQASVIIEYDNGVLATLELCLYAAFGQRQRTYELRGTEGLLRSAEQGEVINLYTHTGRERYEVSTALAGIGHHGGDLLQARRFLRCIQGKEEPPATLIDAKKAAAVALAAETSIVERTTIEIDSRYDLSGIGDGE